MTQYTYYKNGPRSLTAYGQLSDEGWYHTFCIREPGGDLIAREADESLQYYFFDLLGSTILMPHATENNPTDRLFYTPWGELVTSGSRASTIGTTANPYRYVGELGYYYHHQDANLADWLQLGVRFYQPELGRFERRDPVTYNGGESAYPYALGNPATGTDPFGLWCVHFSGKCIGNTCHGDSECPPNKPKPPRPKPGGPSGLVGPPINPVTSWPSPEANCAALCSSACLRFGGCARVTVDRCTGGCSWECAVPGHGSSSTSPTPLRGYP